MDDSSEKFDNKEYFTVGMPTFRTDCPFLVSSSLWLNNPIARDFMARHALRRNHVDVPTAYDITAAPLAVALMRLAPKSASFVHASRVLAAAKFAALANRLNPP